TDQWGIAGQSLRCFLPIRNRRALPRFSPASLTANEAELRRTLTLPHRVVKLAATAGGSHGHRFPTDIAHYKGSVGLRKTGREARMIKTGARAKPSRQGFPSAPGRAWDREGLS